MQSKIQELTDKVYNEGVSKGKEEAERIIADAKKEAGKIISHAKKESESLIEDAKKKSEELKKNTETEIRLSSKQIINKVKQNITEIIFAKIIETPVKEAVNDKEFIASTISKIIENWKPQQSTGFELSLILPEKDKKELDKFIKEKAGKALNEGVEVNFEKGLESGFQIAPKDGSYKVSFSEQEFENFFKEYMKPRLVDLLYGEE